MIVCYNVFSGKKGFKYLDSRLLVRIYLHNQQVLVCSLVGDNLLLREFGPYVIIFMSVCAATSVAVLMLLRNFGSYGIILMAVCVCYSRFSRHSIRVVYYSNFLRWCDLVCHGSQCDS
jgi:hypothetical protein